MSLRKWLRERIRESAEGEELPAGRSLLYKVLAGEPEPTHALGEFTAETYPATLAEVLRRREEVTAELRAMRLGDRQARRDAVPRLQELLRQYPHPLAYHALILAFVDAGRWDDARGAAFAARERRVECEHSPWPEIRGECAALSAWRPEDVDVLRAEAEGRLVTPGVNLPVSAPAPVAVQPSLA